MNSVVWGTKPLRSPAIDSTRRQSDNGDNGDKGHNEDKGPAGWITLRRTVFPLCDLVCLGREMVGADQALCTADK